MNEITITLGCFAQLSAEQTKMIANNILNLDFFAKKKAHKKVPLIFMPLLCIKGGGRWAPENKFDLKIQHQKTHHTQIAIFTGAKIWTKK